MIIIKTKIIAKMIFKRNNSKKNAKNTSNNRVIIMRLEINIMHIMKMLKRRTITDINRLDRRL